MKNLLLVAVATTLAACGGGGSSSGDSSVRRFVGSWSGTYRSAGTETANDITVTVLPSEESRTANVTGGALDAAKGRATVTGTIGEEGATRLSLSFTGGGTTAYQGSSRVDGQSHLRATLSSDDAGTSRTVILDLEPAVIAAQ